MKKGKLTCVRIITAFLSVLIVMASFGTLRTNAAYNDSAYSDYVNLSQSSAVPSLFRNNSVFNSYKEYPPVISGGIEYVPLEIFYGLSGLKINFSQDSTNFYIQNKNNSKYISFSVPGNYAVTNNNNTVDGAFVKTFYGVYYVPLRAVCETIGIGCDSYNDTVNKVYVIKVYTVQGLSAQELIKINAPGIYTTTEDKKQETEEKDEEKDEEKESFGKKTLYLSFAGTGLKNVNAILNTLSANKIKASFFVTYKDIITYPEAVRRIYTGGHTVGITFTESDAELCAQGGIEKYTELAQNALYDVIKTKTRLVYINTENNRALYQVSGIGKRVEEMGLRVIRLDTDAKNSVLGGAAASERLISEIKARAQNSKVYIKMTMTDSSRTVITSLAKLSAEQSGITFAQLNETITQ